MIVVSDTSPIRALTHLGHMDLLHALFGQVLLPPAVESELQNPRARFSPVDVSQFTFICIETPHNRSQVQQFLQTLDLGEAEALTLALEQQAAAVLIDEAAGRRIATQHGLTVVGTLGILVKAKGRGHIDAILPLINRLQNELDFFISAELRAEILRQAGE